MPESNDLLVMSECGLVGDGLYGGVKVVYIKINSTNYWIFVY